MNCGPKPLGVVREQIIVDTTFPPAHSLLQPVYGYSDVAVDSGSSAVLGVFQLLFNCRLTLTIFYIYCYNYTESLSGRHPYFQLCSYNN